MAKKGTTVSRSDLPTGGLTVKEAIASLKLEPKQADAVSGAAAKAVAKVGDSDGLAERISRVAEIGGKGAAKKKAAIKAVNTWRKARLDGIFEQANDALGAAVEGVASAVKWSVDTVIEAANTPAGQQALNAAMLSAGLPPVFSGSATTPDQADAELALAGAELAEPAPVVSPVLAAGAGAAAGFVAGGPLGALLGAGAGYYLSSR